MYPCSTCRRPKPAHHSRKNSFGSFFQNQYSKAFLPLVGSEATFSCFQTHTRNVYREPTAVGTHPTEETILTGVCRKKRKTRKKTNFTTFRPPKEKDLSAECLLPRSTNGRELLYLYKPLHSQKRCAGTWAL